MTDNRSAKVTILIQQKKFGEAERILNDLLAEDSTNIHTLSLLAETHLQQDKYESAMQITDTAIGLMPDSPLLFYIKSRIAFLQDDYSEAEVAIRKSIEFDPNDADYYAFFAHITLSRKHYSEALELADKALEIDAENILGLNTRSTALLKLNKSEESFSTIEGALREDPNNAYTHANYGWGLLEKGQHKQALEHFKESLQNDPHFAYAQSGMLEAIKASNPVYNLFLKYKFWMGNLTSRYQWGVIIGFFLGVRILRSIAGTNKELQPLLIPIIILLSLVAFSTWVIQPLSNVFLRFNKYGQLLLSKEEKICSNFVAASLLFCLTGIVLYGTYDDMNYLTVAAVGFAMMVPFSKMFSSEKHKYILLGYSIAMAAIGIYAIVLAFTTGDIFNSAAVVFLLGFIAFQWIANSLLVSNDS
jgi:tetratricopeptide (TPR) repeat protein